MTTGAPEFQGVLVQLSDRLAIEARKVTGALAQVDRGDAMRYVSDAYPEIASPYLAAAGDLSATWYEDQATTTAGKLFVAKPADLPTVDQLAANGRWALMQQDPGKALVGASRRATFNQSRQTIADNAHEEGVRWVRHARSGACGFCRMLATRVLTEGHGGAPGLYRSEATASRNTHRADAAGHDFCRCIVVPLRDGASYVAPDYLPQWLDDYNAVSRDADGRLLPASTIARRMEALGVERGERAVGAPRVRPKAPKADPIPDPIAEPVDLDAPATERAVARLTDRSAAVEQAARPIAERAEQARIYAEQADQVVATAARYSGQAKQVVDVADKLLGGQIPVVRNVKTIVDAADKALQTANQVSTGVVQVAKVAEVAIADTVAVANGAVQVATEAAAVLDEVTAIALGARNLVGDTAQAIRDTAADARAAPRAFADRLVSEVGGAINSTVRDFEKDVRGVRSVADATNLVDHGLDTAAQNLTDRLGAAFDAAIGELNGRIATAADRAAKIQADGAGLVGRARGLGDQVQGVAGSVAELGEVAQRPLQDVRALAQTVRDVAADVEQAGADAAETTRQVRRLVDAVNDWRAAQRVADGRLELEAPRGPVRVSSERLDVDQSRALPSGRSAVVEDQDAIIDAEVVGIDGMPLELTEARPAVTRTDPDAIEAPARQLAIGPAFQRAPLELPAGRTPLELVAAPQRLAIEAPKVPAPQPGAIAEWLEAEQAHRDALEYWRRVDAEDLVSTEVLEPAAPAVRTVGDELRERVARAEEAIGAPDGRKNPTAKQRAQRNSARSLELKQARRALADAEADGSAAEAIVEKTKRPKAKPASQIEAERVAKYEADMDQAVAAFEDAVAAGDDAALEVATDAMEALENAHDAAKAAYAVQAEKIAAKSEAQRARREAAKQSEQDEIAALIEASGDETVEGFIQAEATVVARRTGKSEHQVLQAIRKREFIRECAGDGISAAGGFEEVLSKKFALMVEWLYMDAELATNTAMIKHKYELTFSPKNLWYCSEATARKVMTEEMAAWFDANGRITKSVMRQMILDGDENFARRTASTTRDFLQ